MNKKNIITFDFICTRRLTESMTYDFIKLTMLGPGHCLGNGLASAVSVYFSKELTFIEKGGKLKIVELLPLTVQQIFKAVII